MTVDRDNNKINGRVLGLEARRPSFVSVIVSTFITIFVTWLASETINVRANTIDLRNDLIRADGIIKTIKEEQERRRTLVYNTSLAERQVRILSELETMRRDIGELKQTVRDINRADRPPLPGRPY